MHPLTCLWYLWTSTQCGALESPPSWMCNDAEAGGLKPVVKNSRALPEILSIKGQVLNIVSLPGGPLVKSQDLEYNGQSSRIVLRWFLRSLRRLVPVPQSTARFHIQSISQVRGQVPLNGLLGALSSSLSGSSAFISDCASENILGNFTDGIVGPFPLFCV